MANLKKIYSDIDLTFARQPISGDISLVYDDRAVINSVRNLLLTNFYERPWQPRLGSNLTKLLFEPVEPLMETTIAAEIRSVITNFESRVTIDSIVVSTNPDENGYDVTLTVFIMNNTQATEVNLFLERNR